MGGQKAVSSPPPTTRVGLWGGGEGDRVKERGGGREDERGMLCHT